MKLQKAKYLGRCINRIKEKYNFSKKELRLLKKIGNHITSIAFTTEGGFEKSNGEFHDEEREVNYKVRIKYKNVKSDQEKIIVLMPVSSASNIYN